MQEVPPSLGDHDKGSPDLQPLTALLGDKSTAKAQLNRQQPLGGVGPSQLADVDRPVFPFCIKICLSIQRTTKLK